MACRLQNLSSQPLTVDLRGGAALTLAGVEQQAVSGDTGR